MRIVCAFLSVLSMIFTGVANAIERPKELPSYEAIREVVVQYYDADVAARLAQAQVRWDEHLNRWMRIPNLHGAALAQAKYNALLESDIGARGPGIELGSCSTGDELGGWKIDDRTALYEFVAELVVPLERELPMYGYPASVWKARVKGFERSQVSRAPTPAAARRVLAGLGDGWDRRSAEGLFLDGLLRDLNAYRSHHKNLPPAEMYSGCGGAGTSVTIQTEPKGARVFLIPDFFYQLCKVNKINPENLSACDYWREAFSIDEIAGDYHYRVQWHDGSVRKGRLDGDSLGRTNKITLQKP
jgi:hypothetical protein